jgi:outer membrane protein OmpA-like peptidoglycan-associated protein
VQIMNNSHCRAGSRAGTTPRRRARALVAAACLAALLAGCQTAPPPAESPRAAQVEALRSLGFAPAEDGWTLNLATPILFDLDSDELKPAQQRSIAAMAVELHRVGIRRIRVEGHTDNVGGSGYNVDLARRRAEAVAREFVEQGFPNVSIERKAWGAAHPTASNDTREGRALNRRVSIVVVAAGADAD